VAEDNMTKMVLYKALWFVHSELQMATLWMFRDFLFQKNGALFI
jgi:hypothetical protein